MSGCERCGATSGLEVHHRDRDPQNNEPKNLETLCKQCHVDEHWPGRAPMPGRQLRAQLVAWEKSAGLTATEAAARLGYSGGMYTLLKNGRRRPALARLAEIASLTGIEPREFYPELDGLK